MPLLDTWKGWARRVKRDATMLWFARNHPDTPLAAKLLCVVTVAYALSPIDLIPDFIPVLGYLDDLILVPALIWLAVRLLPPHVVLQCRQRADAWLAERGKRPSSRVGIALIVVIWIVVAWLIWRWVAAH